MDRPLRPTGDTAGGVAGGPGGGTAGGTGGDPAGDRSAWWVVGAMAIPLFLLSQDFFGVTVALPTIAADLGASVATLEWTINAFLLAFAAPLMAVGRLSDIVGRRRVAMIGIALFAVSSAFCGAAQTAGWLVAARAFQGLSASLLYSTSLSIVSDAFTDDRRATGIGVWTAVGSVGGAVGPIVAGLLTALVSWRWFFWMNVPLAVIGLVLTHRHVAESRDPTARHLDVIGFVLLTAGLVSTTFGLQTWPSTGVSSPVVVIPILAGVGLLVAFAGWQTRAREPLLELGLFRHAPYVSATAVACADNYVFSSTMFLMTLYLQNSLGLGPGQTGLVFLAASVPFAALSAVMGRIVGRFGTWRPMAAGMVIAAIACTMLVGTSPTTGVALVAIALFVQAIGLVIGYDVSTTQAMDAVPDDKAGVASGVISGFRITAMVVGVSVSTIVFDAVAGDDPASDAAYTDGIGAAMALAAAVALAGALAAYLGRPPAPAAPTRTVGTA
jgi:EmrB/QacA subfamily drug resistance transporter